MKILLSITIIGLSFLMIKCMTPEENAAMYESLGVECKAVSGASNSDIDIMLKKEIPNTPEGNCLHACVMEKAGLIVNDVFQAAVFPELTKMVSDNNEKLVAASKEVTDICVQKFTSTNKCDIAHQFMVCQAAESQKRGIDPKQMV